MKTDPGTAGCNRQQYDYLQKDLHNLICKLQDAGLEAFPLAQLLYYDLKNPAEKALQQQRRNVMDRLLETRSHCVQDALTQ